MLLRPHAILVSGELRKGFEVERENGRIAAVRPFRGPTEPFVLSVPFVNAHSHLEYRGLQDRLDGLPYWEWIRELTRLKGEQSEEEVRQDCALAAQENRRTGVGLIGEHSDRPYSGEALAQAGIGGIIFQEVITFFERENPFEKLRTVAVRAERNREAFRGRVQPSPHALYTVDASTLRAFGKNEGPLSIHVAESQHERELFEKGEGPIAEFFVRFGQKPLSLSLSPIEVADRYGLLRPGAQIVHACDVSESDLALLRRSGASVAHCPRSNRALGCPPAPVRQLLRAGVEVGLGMDSAASSGPVDFFAEMRATLAAGEARGEPVPAESVWNMATAMGARSLGVSHWDLLPGFEGPLLVLRLTADSVSDLIEHGTPDHVEWIE
jgi:cytosine/adenosine deaminase-related metal-dependent hydrolase